MKEATGELNATVVVVLAIGILMAFFYYTLWPMINNNFKKNADCNNAICQPCCPSDNPDCDKSECNTVMCHSKDDPDNEFECVYKG